MTQFDVVNHPQHYNSHPSGVAAIEITRYLDFDLGCVFKYVFRRDGKEPVRSLKSAMWYLDDSLANFPVLYTNTQPFKGAYRKMLAVEADDLAKAFYNTFWNFLLSRTPATAALVRESLADLITQYEQKEVVP